jgi:MarR family transcriptional regulator, transcriptional regulator for hemolysin
MSHYDILEKIFKFRRAINLRAVHALKDIGIGPKQAAVLRSISKEGPVSAARIAEFTMSDPAAITRSVDLLEEHGFIEKKDSSTDRRARVLSLTQKGEKAAKQIRAMQESFSAEIFGSLSSHERDALKCLLDKITNVVSIEDNGKGEIK